MEPDVNQLILFTEGFPDHASPLAWQVSKKGKMTQGIYGPKWRGWSEKLSLVGAFLRTYLEFSTSQVTTFAPTWSVLVTTSGYGILKLRLSARTIGEQESHLWRTPDASCGNRGAGSRESAERRRIEGKPLQLNTQVAHPDLFPTPTVNDSKNNGTQSQIDRDSPALNAVVGGQLNPDWVEWMMGFPPGWTEIGGE